MIDNTSDTGLSNGLTNEEKRCLQMWFRQAIARLEQDEALETIVKRHTTDNEPTNSHRHMLGHRRLRRVKQVLHRQEALV